MKPSIEVLDVTPPSVAGSALGSDTRRASAFRAFADRHLERAYRLAYAILRDRTDAEDAIQDAFLQAWRGWGSLRDPDRLDAWFHRIVVNRCRDRLRSRPRVIVHDLSDELAVTARDEIGRSDERDRLERAIARLSPDHQVVIALRFYLDLQVEAIAQRLGIPVGTVQSRLHYALRHLHQVVDRASPDGAPR